MKNALSVVIIKHIIGHCKQDQQMKQKQDSLNVLNASTDGEVILNMDNNFKEKYIKDLTKEDFNIAIAGIIVDKQEGSFILDDGTGQILVNTNNEVKGDFVRVFGRVNVIEDNLQIQGFIVQDLSKVDKFLYKKVKDLM